VEWVEGIIKRAGTAGYRGVAGIDILRTEDGELFVIDLNFRMCFSTPTLLFYPSLLREWKQGCWTVRALKTGAGKSRLFRCLEEAVARKTVMPRQIQRLPGAWNIMVSVGGNSREEVEENFLEVSKACGEII
jgi:hypothetical protein